MASKVFTSSIFLIAGFLVISVVLSLLSQGNWIRTLNPSPPLSEQEWKRVIQNWEKLKGIDQGGKGDTCSLIEYEGTNIRVDGKVVGTILRDPQPAVSGILGTLSNLVLGKAATGRNAEPSSALGQPANGTACHPDCHKHGTCNEELGRCDCRASFAGPDCTDHAMPACWLTPEYYTTCSQPTTCQCTLQCQQYAFAASEPCFDADDIPPASDNLTDIYSRPQVLLRTNGKGKEIGARWATPDGPFRPPHRVQDIAGCPESCNYRAACTEGGSCMCYFTAAGPACETPVRRWDAPWVTCFNRCSGRGRCIEGFCHCRPGAYGIDCSLSLGPDGIPDVWVDSHTRLPRPQAGVRPLVYVYELPPWLNVWLMTHSLVSLDRHEPYQMLERLLHSPHRTTDPAAADYFFVPAWERWRLLRSVYTERVVEYISTEWPYWKRSGGADHLFVMTDDWGPCDEGGVRMRALAPAILLNLWGFTGTMSDRDPEADPLEACFAVGHDIAVPPNLDWNINKHDKLARFSPVIDPELAQPRKLMLYFSGSSGRRQELTGGGASDYSFGIRQAIFNLYEGRQEELNWRLSEPPDPYPDYLHIMADSVFCFGPPGHGWGTRAVQGVLMGCIPVVVADNIVQPWEDEYLDWTDFSIRVAREDMPQLAGILQAVTPEEIQRLQEGMERVWPRFLWHSALESPLNDRELKPSVRARLEEVLEREDAFCTIMEILRNRMSKEEPLKKRKHL